MAFLVADRVREFSTTSGTSDFLLGGAAVGYQTFVAGIGNGNSTYYAVSLPGTTQWEVGVGTVSVGQLTRDTILASSSGGAKVDFSVGTKDIFCTSPADRSLYVLNGQIVAPASGVLPVGSGGTGVTTLGDLITALNVPVLNASNTFTQTNTFAGVVATTADINGGTIDATTIGATTPAGGTFSSVTATTADINGGTVDATTVGATTPAAGTFTDLKATDTVEVPVWTTATRPSTTGTDNLLGFNSDTAEFEGWNGIEWASVGGSKIVQDAATNASLYPVFVDTTSGTAKVVNVDDTKLTYTPASSAMKTGWFITPKVITENITIEAGMTTVTGDRSIAIGTTVTIEPNGQWKIA